MTDLPLLTVSAKRTFQRCAREYQYSYEQRYRPIRTSGALRFGTLFHAALEAWWRAAQAPDADRYSAAVDALQAAVTPETDEYELARAHALLVGYDTRWSEQALEVLAVEVEFATSLVNPETGASSKTWRMAGKLDAIVRDTDGRVLIVEHKTSAEDISQGSEYWRRLQLDQQVSDYYVGARALGYDVAGCLYDVIGKPGLRPSRATAPEDRKYKKDGTLYANQREDDESADAFRERMLEALAENPDRYFQRGPVVRLQEEERDAAFDGWQLGRLIREAQLANRWPRRVDSCVTFNRTCSFFDVCCKVASLEDPSLFRKAAAPHEELSAVASVTPEGGPTT